MDSVTSLIMLLCMISVIFCASGAVYNVVDFGAKGNAKSDDSQAFLKAWGAACADGNNPTLLIPSPKTFFLTKIQFEGPCKSRLHFQLAGTLIASNSVSSNSNLYWITLHGLNGLLIDGGGTINGQGQAWWDCKKKGGCDNAPYSLNIINSQDVAINNINSVNSAAKHLTIHQCSSVIMTGLHITAPGDSPNTDGILISASQNVQVTHSFIATGDDCIAILSGTSNLNISNINCGPGHGISVGSLGKDGEVARVDNVRVQQCNFYNTMFGARVKTWQGGSGYVRGISFQDITLNSVHQPIIIDQYYCNGKSGCRNSTSAVHVNDVSFIEVRGTSNAKEDVSTIEIACSETIGCQGITLQNVKITSSIGGNLKSYCLSASGRKVGVVYPEVSCLSS